MPQIFDRCAINLAQTGGTSALAQQLSNNSTIAIVNQAFIHVTSAASTSLTGIRMPVGTAGQWVHLFLLSGASSLNDLDFDPNPAVSLVADVGRPQTWPGLSANTGRAFVFTGTYWYGEFDI